MLSKSYLVHHLKREIGRLSDYYPRDPMRALAHWAIRQVDPGLSDPRAFEVVRLGGPCDSGIDGVWQHPDGNGLCIVQIKGSENLLEQDPLEVDSDGEDINIDSFPPDAVTELRVGLDRLTAAPPAHPTDRLANSMAEYSTALTAHKRIRLLPIVFGDRTIHFDRAVDDFRNYLAGNRDRMPQHWVEPLDLVGLGDLLDRNFEKPPGSVQVGVSDWPFGPSRAVEGAYIALVPASALAKLRADHELSIYHSNFRYQLRQSPVREGMWATLLDDEERKLFHLYHNGITVLGKEITTADRQLRMRDFQVVNGLQTIETLFEFSRQPRGLDALSDVNVFTRFIDTSTYPVTGPSGRPLDERIAEYSNKQNPITNRDLRSNDAIQKRLQHEIDGEGFKYQRKRGQYSRGIRNVVDNQYAAQLVLSFWLAQPAEAKANSKMLFVKATEDERGYYEMVFPDNIPSSAILLPWLLDGTWGEPRTSRQREVVANGGTIILALMGTVISARYRISLSNAARKSKQLDSIVSKLRSNVLDAPLNRIWPTLVRRLSDSVGRELAERTREAERLGRKPPTVRNILVGYKYLRERSRLLPTSTLRTLCAKLPTV